MKWYFEGIVLFVEGIVCDIDGNLIEGVEIDIW